jgi:hypothetical protein
LTRGALIGLYWKVIGWFLLIAVSFGGYLFATASVIARINHVPVAQLFTPGNQHASIPMLVLAAFGYLVFILVMNVVLRVYLLRDLWARLANATTVHQIEAIDGVSARGDLASALGEGFADGLDIVGF